MKDNWKIGDWCFNEFELKQIKEIEDDRITRLSDGYFNHSGYYLNDTCYPLEMRIKLISQNFKYYSDLLHKVEDLEFKRGFPDIHREIVRRWCECCDDKDDNDKIQKHYSELEEWYYLVTQGIKGLRKKKLEDINEVSKETERNYG